MARDTLVSEGIVNGGTLITTEVTCEIPHVQMMEEHAQDRDALDPILVGERERVVDGADDGLCICLEVLVDLLRQYFPVGALNPGLHIGWNFDGRWWRRGSARLHQELGSHINLRHYGSSEDER